MHQGRRWWLGGLVGAVVAVGREGVGAASREGDRGGLISLDKSLMVQLVNFLILLAILWRLLYRPFLAKMEERRAAIKKALEEAQAARAEAARQQEENAARLRQAHAEAAAIHQQALKAASEEQRRLVAAARREAQQLVESAKAQTDADIRRAREELRREVAELSTAVAEKLIRKSLRDDDHRRIVDDFIALVARQGRADHLETIAAAYRDLVDEDLGRVRARVRAAVPLTPSEHERLQQRLGRTLDGKQVLLEEHVDDRLLGGFIAEVDSFIVDGSLDGQLARLKERLARG